MGSLGPEKAAEHVVNLSPIDQIQPRGYIRVILCFPLPADTLIPSISQTLELALNTTIACWPVFGGTVALAKDGEHSGRLELRYWNPANHAPLHVKALDEFPYTYRELDMAGMPLLPLDEVLFCTVPPIPQSTSPVPAAFVQANFISGGLLLSICLHHGITDGKGAVLLISALANACRYGGEVTSIPPMDPSSWIRTGIFRKSLKGAPDTHLAYKSIKEATTPSNRMLAVASEDSTINRLLAFPVANLMKLKESVVAHLRNPINEWVSMNDCLAALLWSAITRARLPNLSTSTTSSFAVAVDVRGRTAPPLSPTFAGAAVVHSIAISNIPALTYTTPPSSQFADLALSIRKSLRAVDSEYVSQTVSLSEAFSDIRDFGFRISPIYGPDLILTSWRDFSYYDLDFGEIGKPQWVRKPWSRNAAAIVVLPQDRSVGSEKGIEVVLLLREDDMDRLMHDAEFMKWVGRVVK
jgi:trichothecene 3-O-acetyltransferase